jgi:hypothetical protein
MRAARAISSVGWFAIASPYAGGDG